MTLSAPIRLEPLRGVPDPPAAGRGKVVPFSSTPALPRQLILSVQFSSPDGRSWLAVGGGTTLAEALAFAQDSCPTDTDWQPFSWNDLYGD